MPAAWKAAMITVSPPVYDYQPPHSYQGQSIFLSAPIIPLMTAMLGNALFLRPHLEQHSTPRQGSALLCSPTRIYRRSTLLPLYVMSRIINHPSDGDWTCSGLNTYMYQLEPQPRAHTLSLVLAAARPSHPNILPTSERWSGRESDLRARTYQCSGKSELEAHAARCTQH